MEWGSAGVGSKFHALGALAGHSAQSENSVAVHKIWETLLWFLIWGSGVMVSYTSRRGVQIHVSAAENRPSQHSDLDDTIVACLLQAEYDLNRLRTL